MGRGSVDIYVCSFFPTNSRHSKQALPWEKEEEAPMTGRVIFNYVFAKYESRET